MLKIKLIDNPITGKFFDKSIKVTLKLGTLHTKIKKIQYNVKELTSNIVAKLKKDI